MVFSSSNIFDDDYITDSNSESDSDSNVQCAGFDSDWQRKR